MISYEVAAQHAAQAILLNRNIKTALLCIAQKLNFSPNWMTRGSPSEVIEPKPAEPSTTLGFPTGGVLVRLKTSARNFRLPVSPMYVRLMKATSAAVAGAAHWITRTVAQGELRRDREGRGVEPPRRCLPGCREVRVGNAVRSLHAADGVSPANDHHFGRFDEGVDPDAILEPETVRGVARND